MSETTWFRLEERRYAPPLDEFDNPCGEGRLEVVLIEYQVQKETPKGVRLTGNRFVKRDARKRFACPTKEEAKESFEARKARQIRLLKSQICQAEHALSLVKDGDYRTIKVGLPIITTGEEQ